MPSVRSLGRTYCEAFGHFICLRKKIGLYHGIGNVVVVLLFTASWLMRRGPGDGFRMADVPSTTALFCSFAGLVLALVTGWLGGELVERLTIAIHEGANPDAPSSLTKRPPV